MKCSLCGGNLELSPDMTAAICSSCHVVIPLPKIQPVFSRRDARAAETEEKQEQDFILPSPTIVPQEGATVSTLLQQGYQALALHDWRGAAALFRSALEQDENCAEAHFGRTLARQSCESVDALIRKRRRGGNLVRSTLTACQEDRERMAEIERRYSVPGYYSPRQIRMLFEGFDRNYLSVTQAWKDRLQEEYDFWEKDFPLSEAQRCAKGDLALTIRSAKGQVMEELQREVELSETRDRERIERIRAAYNAHLDRAEEEAARRAKTAERSRERDYREACAILERAQTEEELLDCAGRFSALGGYLDSQERNRQCREKIRKAVEEERARELARELQEQRHAIERQAAIRANRRRRQARIALLIAAAVALPLLTAAILFLTPGLLPESVKASTGDTFRQTLGGIFSIFRRGT